MTTDPATYVLEREFAAPRELVWRTLTEADLFCRWYGPNVDTIAHGFDPSPGGAGLIEMRMKDGSGYQRMDFIDVIPLSRIVWRGSNTDAEWTVTANLGMPDWPRPLLTTVALTDTGGGTLLRLEWTPHNPTEAELACFAAAIGSLGQGWNAGMAVLEIMLRELQQT